MKRHAYPLIVGLLLSATVQAAGFRLPAEVMENLVQPWPPRGWTDVLVTNPGEGDQPYRSQPRVQEGYFGQTLYHMAADGRTHWTANVLIVDRGSPGAAWRAVSAVHCRSRVFRGQRARECDHSRHRGRGGPVNKVIHYEMGQFYITIMLSGPGDIPYPYFEIAGIGEGGFP